LPKSNRAKFHTISRKRSGAGLSKPNCVSSFLMNSGSSPCAPRYFELTASADAPTWGRAPKSPPEEPDTREAAPVSAPESWAITRSTGPPGANCTTTKETNRMPSKVGIIRRMRRAI
jgi:hypothetical protein